MQIAMAYVVKDASWWKVLVAAYVVSGTCSQNLFTAQHELSHFLAFRKPLYNRILSLASNCPLVVPMATSFRKYHQEHHSHLVCPLPTFSVLHPAPYAVVSSPGSCHLQSCMLLCLQNPHTSS